MNEREVLILSDQGLWELLNGRISERPERTESMIARMKNATHGVNTMADIELIIRIKGEPDD